MSPLPDPAAAAFAVFLELGWRGATSETMLTLPLGTPEQQKIAKAGLAKGEWGGWEEPEPGHHVWVEHTEGQSNQLSVFAIRVGVSAARAVELLPRWHFASAPALAAVVASRGEAFVGQFIAQARAPRWHQPVITELLATVGGEVPTDANYLSRWAWNAHHTLAEEPVLDRAEAFATEDAVVARYDDHIRTLLMSGGASELSWVGALHRGVQRGLISQDDARVLALYALGASARPIDRKTWALALVTELEADNDYLLAHAGEILAALSFSEDALINLFTPVLLSAGDDDLTLQTLLIGLGAKSAKARAGVLAAAASAPTPAPETRAALTDSIGVLLGDKDKKVRANAEALLAAWNMSASAPEQQETRAATGLWQATPPLAEVPRFDAGPATAENLTALVSAALAEGAESTTLTLERFLATANALASTDMSATRTALKPIGRTWNAGLHPVHGWLRGETMIGTDVAGTESQRAQISPPERARAVAVFRQLGEVPALLSTPSFDDYRVSPEDLAERLDAYQDADAVAGESDLFLALLRLDRAALTAELTARLVASRVTIALDDSTHALTVGELIELWLSEPFDHPGFGEDHRALPLPEHPALAVLPPRLPRDGYGELAITVFPTWPEAEPSYRQLHATTVRNVPNGSAPATTLLAFEPEGIHDYEAAITAWQNGVLVPGAARIDHMVWNGAVAGLASRVAAWEELAHAGLLSLVWPLAADAVAFSARQTRIPPGTAEAIEFLERMLPEAQLAISSGLAPAETLELPGVRAIAQKRGTSNAVAAAKKLAAVLPEAPEVPEPAVPHLTPEQFAAAWEDLPDNAVIPDGASITFASADKAVIAHITLADGSVRTYGGTWSWGLAYRASISVGDDTFLAYDAGAGALIARIGRDSDAEEVYGSHTVSVAMLLALQDTSAQYYIHHAATNGLLGAQRVTDAIVTLLTESDFDPYVAARMLAKDGSALSVLYPLLTRPIAHAATLGSKPPAWLVRIIDVATTHAPVLRAARDAMNPADAAWPGLAHIAKTTTSAAVKRKAAALADALGVTLP